MNKGSKGVEGKAADESSRRSLATQSKPSAARTGEQQVRRKGKAKTEGAARKRRTPFVL